MSDLGGHDDHTRACRAVLDGSAVAAILNPAVAVRGHVRGTISDVLVQRIWPYRDSGVVVEWSFLLDSTRRYTLFGIVAPVGMDGHSAVTAFSPAPVPDVVDGTLRGVDIRIPEIFLRIVSPDRDPGIPHLRSCLDRIEMHGALGGVAALRREGEQLEDVSSCALLGYRLGRRAAIAYDLRMTDGTGHRVVGKTFRDGRGREMLDRLRRLRAALAKVGGEVMVPAPIDYLPDYRMSLCTEVSRDDNAAVGSEGVCPPVVVDALAALHRSDVSGLPRFEAADEMRIVERWERLVRLLRPDPSPTLPRLVAELSARAMKIARPKACVIHRDFYRAQLLVGRNSCAIVDLDTLALGDPSVDIGNLIAHSFLHELEQRDHARSIHDIAHEVIGAYRMLGECVDEDSWPFYLATSLCRLGAVHAFRSATGRFAEPLWQAGVTLLEVDKNSVTSGRVPAASLRAVPGKAKRQEVAP